MMDRDELLQAHTVAQIMANPRLKILYATYPFQAGQPEAVRQAFSNAMGIEAKAYARLGELGASPLGSIRTAGGGAANAAWTKIRLMALGVPEKPSLSEHAAAGTARLAWRGLGHAN